MGVGVVSKQLYFPSPIEVIDADRKHRLIYNSDLQQKLLAASMSFTAIPQDIFSCILDELPKHDHLTLMACSTVARCFVEPCQARLFRQITISTHVGRCRRLREVLTRSPHIGHYIRILILEPHRSTRAVTFTISFIFCEERLPPLLDLLPIGSLRALRLKLPPGEPWALIDWQKFSPELQVSFLRILQSPNLSTVELEQCLRVPLIIFSRIRQLRELLLPGSEVIYAEPVPSEHDIAFDKPRIASLSMSAGPRQRSLLKTLSSTMDLTHLQRLTLEDFDDEIFTSLELKRLCGPTLQRLKWKVEGNLHSNFTNTHQIGLSISPTLRSLEVWGLGVKDSGLTPIPWSLQALRGLITHPSKSFLLEDLTIRHLAESTDLKEMYQLWGGFDEVLSNLEVFPCLKRVVTISAWLNGNELDPRREHRSQKLYIGMILRSLPRLHARGILNTTVCPRVAYG